MSNRSHIFDDTNGYHSNGKTILAFNHPYLISVRLSNHQSYYSLVLRKQSHQAPAPLSQNLKGLLGNNCFPMRIERYRCFGCQIIRIEQLLATNTSPVESE